MLCYRHHHQGYGLVEEFLLQRVYPTTLLLATYFRFSKCFKNHTVHLKKHQSPGKRAN